MIKEHLLSCLDGNVENAARAKVRCARSKLGWGQNVKEKVDRSGKIGCTLRGDVGIADMGMHGDRCF